MGKIILQTKNWQAYRLEWGGIEFRILGNPSGEMACYVPVACIEEKIEEGLNQENEHNLKRDLEKQENFYNRAVNALRSYFNLRNSVAYREKALEGKVDAIKVWKKIKKLNNLSDDYDIEKIKELEAV